MSGCIHTTYISYSTASYWTHSFPFPSLAGTDDFSYYVIDSKVDRQDSPCGLYYYPCLRVLSPRKHLESRNLLPDQYPMISNQTLYFLFLSHSLECRCWSCFINWLFTRLELGLMLLCYKSSLQMLCYRIRVNEIALLSQWTEEILYLGKKFYCLWKPKDIDDISSVQTTTAHVSFSFLTYGSIDRPKKPRSFNLFNKLEVVSDTIRTINSDPTLSKSARQHNRNAPCKCIVITMRASDAARSQGVLSFRKLLQSSDMWWRP